jgi:hypothetical protein
VYGEAKALLDDAEKLQPALTAIYFWQTLRLNYYTFDCVSDPKQANYSAQCNEYRKKIVTFQEAGLAPLWMHDRFLEMVGDCAT